MSRINRYKDFYLHSKSISNQNKNKQIQEFSNQIFESKVRKGGNLDLIDVLLEKEAYKEGKLNESFSSYLKDEEFKQELRFNSCAGLVSEGLEDLKSKSLTYLKERGISERELELVDRNFDILYLGDDRLLEGFLKWVGSALATALSPVIDYILKPGWEALKFVGTKMFGEEVMKKIEQMGQNLINKITGAFDKLDQKFQNVLDKTWSGIKSIAQRIGDFLKSFWELCKKVFNKIWEFIKSGAKGAMSVVTNNPKLTKLKNTLATAEPSQNESAESGAIDTEIATYTNHLKMLFGLFNNGPASSENQKSAIDSSANKTFNPDGNTEVKVEENQNSFGKQVNFICDSLLWELKTNKNFTAEDLVNMNESKIYESSEGGASLESVRKEGPAGEKAFELYKKLDSVGGLFSSKEKQANQAVESINQAIKNIKEDNIDLKEVVKHVEELFKSLRKKRVAKWALDKFGDYEDGENQLKVQKALKEAGFLYDPFIDMDDKQKEESKKFWKELGSGSGRTENLMKMMKNWTSTDYQRYDKQAKFKLKTGEIKKTKVGDPSLSVAIRSELEPYSEGWNSIMQKFLFEEKDKKNLPEDFIVDAKLKASDETKDVWGKFAKIWNGGKNSNELEGLLTSIEEPKVYDELDNICRQELGFSLKKKIKDEFSGMFTKSSSKEAVERIIKHFDQEKFGETNLKSEEAAEESGFIKKWLQSAVSFLISPFGKIMEYISEFAGKLISFLPGIFFYSIQTLISTFKALPLLLGVLVGIGIDSYCTYKGIKSLGGHNAGEAHAEPEGFFGIIGARVTHGAEAIGVISKHESVSTEESTEVTNKPIIKKYDQFINESKNQIINESSKGEAKEESHGFQWGQIAALGTGLLMAYVANLFTVAFPPVGVTLEFISVLFLTLHLLDLLREFSPKWFGEKSRMSVVTTPIHKFMAAIGMSH